MALTLIGGLLLAGCGDDPGEDAGSVSSTDHNDADVTFASDMVQHHAQALAMVDLTVERDLDPEVQQVVEAIRAAQAPEIETMSDWLTQWGEPVPATVNDHVNADGHGNHDEDDPDAGDEAGDDLGMDMPGMMSDEQMADLAAAPDVEFQDLFLSMMVEHHEGAVEMARVEQDEGRFEAAVELAEQIETGQLAEIDTMRGLLGPDAP